MRIIPYHQELQGQGSMSEILLYGLIEVLSFKEGYCFASNQYLAENFNMTKGSVANLLAKIAKKGWIIVELDEQNHRTSIKPNLTITALTNELTPQSSTNEPPHNQKINKYIKNIYKEYSNTIIKDNSIPPNFEEALELARYLQYEILKRYPNNVGANKKNCANRWAVDIEKMIRLDKRNIESIKNAIDFAMNDSFWQRNIWSGANLRKHYDRLEADARSRFLKYGQIVV